MQSKISKGLQPLLWSKNVAKLDLRRDQNYNIHQVLSYGDLKHLRWLFNVYKISAIRSVFIKSPQKIYQRAIFYFVKNSVLGLKNKNLEEKYYVKSLF